MHAQNVRLLRALAVVGVALAWMAPGCQAGQLEDAAGTDAGADGSLDAPKAGDDAEVVTAKFSDHLACGETQTATVVLRNTGTNSWSRAAGYQLGGPTPDPLHAGDPRVQLVDGDTVIPGATHAFEIALTGPAAAGKYTARWQMAHGATAFGAVASQEIVVDCAGDGGTGDATDTAPDADVTSLDLATATVMNSPADIATWSETAKITTLDLGAGGVFIDFTKRDGAGSWPDVPFLTPGEDLEYTLWIVINVGGKWYTSGCIQYWRGLDRNGGPPSEYAKNWYYDAGRWGAMTGHQPAVGEKVGFFVAAGNHRNVTDHSTSKVLERSNVVVVPFPSDTGAVFKY